jgi:hypothetical protein
VSTAAPVALSPPAAGSPGVVERIVRSPGRFCLAALVITVAGLALDRYADLTVQTLLGICTWAFLAVAFAHLSPMERAQTSVVVVVATCAEVIGSVIWGVYEYRLGNLPLFVPPGHGIVYLTGLRLSQMSWARRRPRLLVGAAIAGVSGWALLGLVALGRTDVAGAVGAAVLVLFLLRGRAPTVYAGVFFAVAFLEIYGTAVGTWTWAEEIPGLGVPDGNPPSGAASGYVLFDIAALALAPSLLALCARVRRRYGAPAAPARNSAQAAAWPSRRTPASVTSVGQSGSGAPASSLGAETTACQRTTVTSQPTSVKSRDRSWSRSGGPTSR